MSETEGGKFLTKVEEDLLADLNRLVEFYENSKSRCKRLVLSKRQSEQMCRSRSGREGSYFQTTARLQ